MVYYLIINNFEFMIKLNGLKYSFMMQILSKYLKRKNY